MFPQVVRSNDKCTDAEMEYTNFSTSGGTTLPTVTTKLISKRALGGVQTAGFNKTRNFKKGVFSINPFSIVRWECTCTGVSNLKLYIPWYGKPIQVREISGDLPMWCSPPFPASYPMALPNIPGTVDSDLIIRASAKSKAADVLAAVTLKELPETLMLMATPFSRLPRALAKLAPKRKKKGRRLLDYASNAWNASMFGILPLMSEIDAYREIANSQMSVLVDISKHRAGKTTPTYFSEASFERALGFCRVRGVQNVRRETKLMATAYTSGSMDGASRLGMDVSNIPATLWETIPYSFVLDWWIDVGSWLRYITPHPEVRDLGATFSVADISSAEIHISNVSADGQLWTSPGGSAKCTQTSYARTTTPIRGYYPELKNGLDRITNIISSLTLSHQRVKPYLITR